MGETIIKGQIMQAFPEKATLSITIECVQPDEPSEDRSRYTELSSVIFSRDDGLRKPISTSKFAERFRGPLAILRKRSWTLPNEAPDMTDGTQTTNVRRSLVSLVRNPVRTRTHC